MLPKVDYVLITSLFVCLKERLASGILENMVMVCNGTVWRRTVPVFIQESEGRNCFMSQIRVNNLTFCYEGSFDNIFEDISFSIDTNWKLGFIGRNGKGKTTFLNLLLGNYEYEGSIHASVVFDYFPYPIGINGK